MTGAHLPGMIARRAGRRTLKAMRLAITAAPPLMASTDDANESAAARDRVRPPRQR
jgi:hypothetical protein